MKDEDLSKLTPEQVREKIEENRVFWEQYSALRRHYKDALKPHTSIDTKEMSPTKKNPDLYRVKVSGWINDKEFYPTTGYGSDYIVAFKIAINDAANSIGESLIGLRPKDVAEDHDLEDLIAEIDKLPKSSKARLLTHLAKAVTSE